METQTIVQASFSIYGDDFDLNAVIKKMEIEATETTIKGIIPDGARRESPQTSWTLGTEEENSFDINDQLNQIIDQLKPKKQLLLEIKNTFNVNFVFTFLIKIENNDKPAIYFESESLDFINGIGAEIDIDYYIYSL